MKIATTAAALSFVAVAACQNRAGQEAARDADAADTIVTAEQRVDTTIVTRDTTVEVDTIRKKSDRPVRRDTLQRSSNAGTTPSTTPPAGTPPAGDTAGTADAVQP
jgi:hypothetical protein